MHIQNFPNKSNISKICMKLMLSHSDKEFISVLPTKVTHFYSYKDRKKEEEKEKHCFMTFLRNKIMHAWVKCFFVSKL